MVQYHKQKPLHDTLFRNLTLAFTVGSCLAGAYAGFTVVDTLTLKQSPRYAELRQVYKTVDNLDDKLSSLIMASEEDKQMIINNLTREYNSSLQKYNQLNDQGIVDEYYNMRLKGVKDFGLYSSLTLLLILCATGSSLKYNDYLGEKKLRQKIKLH